MYSHHCENEPQKQPVPGPSASVVLDPEDIFNDEELAFEPAASPDDFGCANLEHAAATFILKVQETHQLPQTTMDIILKEIDSLYQVRKMGIYNLPVCPQFNIPCVIHVHRFVCVLSRYTVHVTSIFHLGGTSEYS